MKPQPPKIGSLQSLFEEHRALQAECQQWRDWWTELSEMGAPHFGEMGDRLATFREHLASHFRHEETDGPLADRETPEVRALWQDHVELLSNLDLLIDRLHACGPEVGCWGDARRDFESFLDRLCQHDEAENRLMSAAGE
ncbi:MAG: hemerythrin domain-containing protein [Planctomycetaceae bacterium]|nr:hemerythrin domain-containing protein [Planctomycetaceae bacterium]